MDEQAILLPDATPTTTAQRRWPSRVLTGAVALLVVGAFATVTTVVLRSALRPSAPAIAGAALASTATPTADPPTPSSSATVAPATPSEAAASTTQSDQSGRGPEPTRAPTPPVCTLARIKGPLPPPTVTFAFDPTAPGCDVPNAASIRVFVAVYVLDPDGVARLQHKTEDRVSPAKPTVTLPLDLPRSCSLFWVGGHGNVTIPATLAAPAPDPTNETLGAPFDFGLPDRVWDVMPPC